jgi:hypothetical protein
MTNPFIYRKLSVLFLLFITFGNVYSKNKEMEQLFSRLDSVLTNSEKYVLEKEDKIEELRKKQSMSLKPEEKLWLNKMLYDEYFVYNADSAMVYVNNNIEIANALGRKDKEQEWILHKVFLLAAQGLLNEAEKELLNVDITSLSKENMYQYYDTKIYLYSHLVQFIGNRLELTNSYYNLEKEFKHEAKKYITPDHPSYYSFCASLHREYPRSAEGDSIKLKLKNIVDKSSLSTRVDAINSYMLAIMFYNEGDEDNYVKYLIYSAIADIKICNRDIASLEELSNILYLREDIDRGYTYISYCFKAKDYVTGVSPISEGEKEVGYTIMFSKSGAVTIYNGKDGVKGADGISPVIGVAKDTDGFYYWTIKMGDADATWMKDADGNKIRTIARSGNVVMVALDKSNTSIEVRFSRIYRKSSLLIAPITDNCFTVAGFAILSDRVPVLLSITFASLSALNQTMRLTEDSFPLLSIMVTRRTA